MCRSGARLYISINSLWVLLNRVCLHNMSGLLVPSSVCARHGARFCFSSKPRPQGRCRLHIHASAGAGKAAFITGGNTGIGYETAKALAAQGYATVIACRDIVKGQAARDKIKAEVSNAKCEAVPLDLANLNSIRGLADKCLAGGRPIDVLINNAGVMACPRMETQDGFEYQLGVNHLGHYLLTLMLLPLLTDPSRPSRIINVSSSAHKFGRMSFDDLMSTREYTKWGAYSQSKLANVLFTYELDRRLHHSANCTVNALHPGVVRTELARYLIEDTPSWQRPLFKVVELFTKSPVQGAQTSIYLATSPQVEGVTSKYYVDCKLQETNEESYSLDVARKLWDVSAELTNAPVSNVTHVTQLAK